MAEFASNAKGNAALTTGIIGTSLGGLMALGGNLLGGLGIGGNRCTEDHYVNRYELGKEQQIAKLETENSLLKSNIYTDQKISDVFERLSIRIRATEDGLAQQAVYNATNTATMGCIQNQVNQLMGLTKLVVPNSNVCPGWGNVTITPATSTTTT